MAAYTVVLLDEANSQAKAMTSQGNSGDVLKSNGADVAPTWLTPPWQDALTFGIADTNAVKIDGVGVANNDYAKFTTGGLVGRSYAEVRSDLALVVGTNVQAYSSVLQNTTASYTTTLNTKLSGIETEADVTDATNVTAAGALMDSEVDADIKTLALPANTTISVFGASLIDDAAASNARTTLGLVIGTNVLAQRTIGIANNNLVKINQVGVVDNDFAKFTGSGLEGRSYAQVRTDLGLVIGTNVQAYSSVLQNTTASYTTTLNNKLNAIEAGANVTDATNVNAAGATMNTDTTLAGNGYFLDQDAMTSNSATKVASQQSIKAYVDNNSGGGWEYIETLGNLTGATAVIDNLGSAKQYKFVFINCKPATDTQYFKFTLSSNNGSTYISSGYNSTAIAYAENAVYDYVDSQATSEGGIIPWDMRVGTNTGEGFSANFYLNFPSSTATYTMWHGSGVVHDSVGRTSMFDFGGVQESSANINAIKFYWNSGNFESGYIVVYGLKE